jgi:hypothetical protein
MVQMVRAAEEGRQPALDGAALHAALHAVGR